MTYRNPGTTCELNTGPPDFAAASCGLRALPSWAPPQPRGKTHRVDRQRPFVSRRAALNTCVQPRFHAGNPQTPAPRTGATERRLRLPMPNDRYNAREAEPRWQQVWDERGIFAHPQRRPAAEILRAGDVPLSVGAHPHGPRAQLHDGRRGGALQAREGLQRAASDGLGRLRHAGRERRHGAQGPSARLDLREHRRDEGAAQVDGPVARLEPRDRDLRPGLLQAPAGDVPRFPARRPGRAQAVEGQLGPGRPDRARQRAGDRRPRLALRRGGRAARADAVVLQDHRLSRRSCSTRSTGSTAGRRRCG